MSQNYIKYPVAYNFKENSIMPIDEVTKENKLNLICPDCKNNYIAVLNHQTPHFKHKPHSTCKGSYESYIHWLTKEVLKTIKEIEFPKLLINDLPEKNRQNFQSKLNKIIDKNIPETYRSKFKKELKNELFESSKASVDTYEIEKVYKTELGDIIVDVVANIKSKKIFIEPFFSNPIDEEKKKKLSLIEIPTLSIDLSKFIDSYGQNYSMKSLKKYLISKKSKTWVYLSNNKYNEYIENYEKYLHKEIVRNRKLIAIHNSKLIEIKELEGEVQDLNIEITDLKKRITNLKIELGINY